MWMFPPNGITILLPKGSYQPFPLGEVLGELHLYSWSSAKSLSASSSMVAPWWLSSLLSLESPEMEALMWGFLIATLPTEPITVSLGVTLVASKFSLPTEAVTVSKHCFSTPTWLECVGGLASLSPSPLVGTTQFSTMVRLAAQEVIRSLGHQCQFWPLAPLCHPWGDSTDTGRLVSAAKVMGFARGASSLGVHPGDARMVLSVPWVVAGWGSTPPISVVVGEAMVPSGGASVSWLPASGTAPLDHRKHPAYWRWYAPPFTTLILLHSSPKGNKCLMLVD